MRAGGFWQETKILGDAAVAANYPAVWPNDILIHAVGGHYDVTQTAQASLGLGAKPHR